MMLNTGMKHKEEIIMTMIKTKNITKFVTAREQSLITLIMRMMLLNVLTRHSIITRTIPTLIIVFMCILSKNGSIRLIIDGEGTRKI